MNPIGLAFALTTLAGAATVLGGWLALSVHRDRPGFMSFALGLSAGAMLYISFMEIFPKGIAALGGSRSSTAYALAAFFAGMALVAALDRVIARPMSLSSGAAPSHPGARLRRTGIVVAVAVAAHNFPEGLATFLVTLEGASASVALALAIAIHNIPEGIAVAAPLYAATGRRWRALGASAIAGAAEPAGALAGYLLLAPLMGGATLGVVLALVAGVMVFVAIHELIPVARSHPRPQWAAHGTIVGMALMAVSLILLAPNDPTRTPQRARCWRTAQ